MKAKYNILVGQPLADVHHDDSHWGYCYSLAAARKRAKSISRSIRSDCRVGIEVGGIVIEQSGLAPFFSGNPRPTDPISAAARGLTPAASR